MKPDPQTFDRMIDQAARSAWLYHQFRRNLAALLKEWRNAHRTNQEAAHH